MESYNILIKETMTNNLNMKEKLTVGQKESSNLPKNLGNQQRL